MNRDPIFILTAPRSGSTLLRVMLAGHARLFCPPELRLVEFETMREREASLGPCNFGGCSKHTCDQRHGFQRALMDLHQIDEGFSRQMIDAMLDRNETTTHAFHMLIDQAAPRSVVDKSPSYAARLEVLEKSACLFPKARYIYIHRHPGAVIESMVRNGFESSPVKAETVWTTRNANIQQFLSALTRERQIWVAYERFVRGPESTLREICSFLDLAFHPDVLTPYKGSRMTDGIRPGTLPPGDWNFTNHRDIDPRHADAWRDLDSQQSFCEKTLQLSAVLAYDVRDAAPVRD
jgi:hypothetical protein